MQITADVQAWFGGNRRNRKFLISVASLLLVAQVQANCAWAAVDQRLAGFWVIRKESGDPGLLLVNADGTATFNKFGDPNTDSFTLETARNRWKISTQSDDDAAYFAFPTEDFMVLAPPGNDNAVLIRVTEDRWNELRNNESAEIPELEDFRFNILKDPNAVKELLCNLDSRMIGYWISQASNNTRGLLSIRKNGTCVSETFPEKDTKNGWIMRSGDALQMCDSTSKPVNLTYSFNGVDEMILRDPTDAHEFVIAVKIPEDRWTALQQGDSLDAAPEAGRLNTTMRSMFRRRSGGE